ncbi:MAG: hypothetical protein PHH30_07515 [Bacteroidales bacterium]|nr:hypothetical protein [Bacteroidales bacterium]
MNRRTNEQKNKRTEEQTNKRTEEQTNYEQSNKRITNRRTNEGRTA